MLASKKVAKVEHQSLDGKAPATRKKTSVIAVDSVPSMPCNSWYFTWTVISTTVI
jgi:hypothetical protein